jgi:hypothetical protein
MFANDHRSHGSPLAGAVAGVAMTGYVLPALAGSWPAGFPRSPAPIWPALRGARRAARIAATQRRHPAPHPRAGLGSRKSA